MDWTFTLFGITMPVIEAIGAVVGTIYIILEYKASSWLWLFGLLMPLFYIYLFFSNHVYANALINVYYVIISFYGIFSWKKMKESTSQEEELLHIQSFPKKHYPLLILSTLALTAILAFILRQLGESEVALLDGLTASLNIVGMWMLAKKYYQQWICWIIIEPIMVVLSLKTHMFPTAVMYFIYCFIAVMGYRKWKKDYTLTTKKQ